MNLSCFSLQHLLLRTDSPTNCNVMYSVLSIHVLGFAFCCVGILAGWSTVRSSLDSSMSMVEKGMDGMGWSATQAH